MLVDACGNCDEISSLLMMVFEQALSQIPQPIDSSVSVDVRL